MHQALLIIDMQHGLVDAVPRPDDIDAVIARINALVTRARDASVPVVWVQHERAGTAVEFGSVGWALTVELHQHETDLKVRKTTPDAFLHTGLHELLAAHAVDHVVISGFASEFCVDTTTRRAAALGYRVTLAADAHTTHDKPHASARQIREHHNCTLADITSFGSQIKAVAAADVAFGG